MRGDYTNYPRLAKIAVSNIPRTMQNFITYFRRMGPGVWICEKPATLDLPSGRVQVAPGTQLTLGTKFMDVEVAALLEEEYKRGGTSGG